MDTCNNQCIPLSLISHTRTHALNRYVHSLLHMFVQTSNTNSFLHPFIILSQGVRSKFSARCFASVCYAFICVRLRGIILAYSVLHDCIMLSQCVRGNVFANSDLRQCILFSQCVRGIVLAYGVLHQCIMLSQCVNGTFSAKSVLHECVISVYNAFTMCKNQVLC